MLNLFPMVPTPVLERFVFERVRGIARGIQPESVKRLFCFLVAGKPNAHTITSRYRLHWRIREQGVFRAELDMGWKISHTSKDRVCKWV